MNGEWIEISDLNNWVDQNIYRNHEDLRDEQTLEDCQKPNFEHADFKMVVLSWLVEYMWLESG
jgi:hypothetical protein